MTALGATASEHEAAALGARTNEEAMRANTLDLGGLIGTLGSHDESLPSVNSLKKGADALWKKELRAVNTRPKESPVSFVQPYASHFRRSSSDARTCENSILHSISPPSVNTQQAENQRFFMAHVISLPENGRSGGYQQVLHKHLWTTRKYYAKTICTIIW